MSSKSKYVVYPQVIRYGCINHPTGYAHAFE